MTKFEWLAVGYFVGLALAAPWAAASWRRRAYVVAGAMVIATSIGAIASVGNTVVRAWLPHLYLVLGYWLPAWLVELTPQSTRFEAWLLRSEEYLRARRFGMPGWLIHVVELAYLVCYPLVPISFSLIWIWGTPQDVQRFWLAVLGAGYACYVSLPWLISRPPRLVDEVVHAPGRVRAVNVLVLSHVSHRMTTFPSGHVAVSAAAAISVTDVAPAAAMALGAIVVAIAAGAVAGRYHYVLDVILGVAVAAAATVLARVLAV